MNPHHITMTRFRAETVDPMRRIKKKPWRRPGWTETKSPRSSGRGDAGLLVRTQSDRIKTATHQARATNGRRERKKRGRVCGRSIFYSGRRDFEVMACLAPQRRRRAGHRRHRCRTMQMRGVKYVSDLLLIAPSRTHPSTHSRLPHLDIEHIQVHIRTCRRGSLFQLRLKKARHPAREHLPTGGGTEVLDEASSISGDMRSGSPRGSLFCLWRRSWSRPAT
jgi:hypothetical protein